MIDKLFGLVAPHICCACNQENAILCDNCFFDIIDEPFGRCLKCLQPTVSSNICRGCKYDLNIDNAWAVGLRRDALKKLIDQYKFDYNQEAASALARLMSQRLPQLEDDTVLCYIPDIASHRRQRGHDHMRTFTSELGGVRNLSVEPLLSRQTSLAQRGHSRTQRLKRQVGAFRAAESSTDKPVLLIDDIFTTGATLTAGIDALRDAGYSKISIAVIARQPLDVVHDL